MKVVRIGEAYIGIVEQDMALLESRQPSSLYKACVLGTHIALARVWRYNIRIDTGNCLEFAPRIANMNVSLQTAVPTGSVACCQFIIRIIAVKERQT